MSDWHNYFLICHDAGMKVPVNQRSHSHFKWAHIFTLWYAWTRHVLCIYPTSVPAHATRMGKVHIQWLKYILLFLMLLVIKTVKTRVIMARLTMIWENLLLKHYPDDHLWCHGAKRRVHKILILFDFLLRRYLTSVWCHVFHKRCHVNAVNFYFCSIRIVIKELNDMYKFLNHSTYKFYSPEFRWWAIFVDQALIILSIV